MVGPLDLVAWKVGRNYGRWHLTHDNKHTLCAIRIGRHPCWAFPVVVDETCKTCLAAYSKEEE